MKVLLKPAELLGFNFRFNDYIWNSWLIVAFYALKVFTFRCNDLWAIPYRPKAMYAKVLRPPGTGRVYVNEWVRRLCLFVFDQSRNEHMFSADEVLWSLRVKIIIIKKKEKHQKSWSVGAATGLRIFLAVETKPYLFKKKKKNPLRSDLYYDDRCIEVFVWILHRSEKNIK